MDKSRQNKYEILFEQMLRQLHIEVYRLGAGVYRLHSEELCLDEKQNYRNAQDIVESLEWAISDTFFGDLAEYEQLYDNWRYHRTDINLPMPAVCVYKAYEAMFNAFDKFLIDTIGIHYEVETWDDPLGEVTGSETVFGEQAARDRYNEIVTDGYYARLLKVDGEGFPIYIVEANF